MDARDLAVVKTDGKAVPDILSGGNQNLFPRFVTYRENIEGAFWFPTYTHADDFLHFSSGDVHIRMTGEIQELQALWFHGQAGTIERDSRRAVQFSAFADGARAEQMGIEVWELQACRFGTQHNFQATVAAVVQLLG